MRVFLLLAALLAAIPAHAAQHVAVLEFQGQEDAATRALLTDRVREGVLAAVRGGDYVVMTRENMASMARDMGLDLACAEAGAECEVDLGRNIGAQLVVSGSIGSLGGNLIATLKLHDTASGALMASNSADAKDAMGLHGVLPAAAQALMRDGLGVSPMVNEGAIGESRQSMDLGSDENVVVRFSSEPEGAVVMLDGSLVCPATPCSREVPAGAHRVEMQREEYHPATTSIEASKGSSVTLKLAPRFALLTVKTVPGGLPFTIDGRSPSGPGPYRLPAGAHEVVAADRCYLGQGERLALQDGDERSITLKPEQRIAGLAVSAKDSDGNALEGDVLVDGVSRGLTPTRFELPLCSERVEVRVSGQAPYERSLSLEEGQLTKVQAELKATTRSTSSRPSKSDGIAEGVDDAELVRLRALIASDPEHPELPTRINDLIKLYWQSDNFDEANDEINNLVRTCWDHDGRWWRANTGNRDALKEAEKLVEKNLRNVAIDAHQQALKRRSAKLLLLAEENYLRYLEAFETGHKTYEMRYWYAEVLYKLKKYDLAAGEYKRVVEQDPKGKFAKVAAENRVFAIDAYLKPIREKLDDAAVKGLDRQKGRSGAARYEPIPLHPWEERRVDACEAYFRYFRESNNAPNYLFRAGFFLQNRSHLRRASALLLEAIEADPHTKAVELAITSVMDNFEKLEDARGGARAADRIIHSGAKLSEKLRGQLEGYAAP